MTRVVCTMHILSFYCVFHQIHFVLLSHINTKPFQLKWKKKYFFASLFTSFHTRVPINFSRSRSLIVSLLKFSQQNVPLAGAISKWDKKPKIRSCYFESYHVLLFSVLTNVKPCLLQGLAALLARVSEDLFLCLVLLNPTEFWHCYKHWCNDSIVKEVALVDVFNTSKIVQNSVDHNQ